MQKPVINLVTVVHYLTLTQVAIILRDTDMIIYTDFAVTNRVKVLRDAVLVLTLVTAATTSLCTIIVI